MIILYVVTLSIIAGLLYAAGGFGKPFNTKYRDFGVPACMLLLMTLLGHSHWSLILCFGALFGSMTTYNKWVGYFFNRPDKHTVYLESWVVTGIFYGLAMIPYAIFTHNWLDFGIRCAICTILIPLFSQLIGKRFWEEFSRGVVTIASLSAFLIK